MLEHQEKLKADDLAVSYLFSEICKSLASKKLNTKLVNNLILKFNPKVAKLKKNYQKFLKQYSTNSEIILNYGTMLITLFNDQKQGSALLTKRAASLRSVSNYSFSLNPFREYAGNIVIDCSLNKFLLVSESNENANRYLGYKEKLIGMRATKLIPGLFEDSTPSKFNILLLEETHLPGSFFLFTKNSILIPVHFKLSYDTIRLDHKILLTFLKNYEFLGEAAMIRKNGCLMGHTRNFGTVLGLNKYLVDEFMQNLLPLHSSIIEYFYQPLHFQKDIYLFSYCIEINKNLLIIILALKGENELKF